MRKNFTYKDVRSWKVVNVEGKKIAFSVTKRDGSKEVVSSFDGFRSALSAAKRHGDGTPVRE